MTLKKAFVAIALCVAVAALLSADNGNNNNGSNNTDNDNDHAEDRPTPGEAQAAAALEEYLAGEAARVTIPFDRRTVTGASSPEIEEMLAEHEGYFRLTLEQDEMLEVLVDAGLLERHEPDLDREAPEDTVDEADLGGADAEGSPAGGGSAVHYVYTVTDAGAEALHPERTPVSLGSGFAFGSYELSEITEIGAGFERRGMNTVEVEFEYEAVEIASWFEEHRSALLRAARPRQVDDHDSPQNDTAVLVEGPDGWVHEDLLEQD